VDALCRSLSDKSPGALRLLKTHLAREFDVRVAAMDAALASDEEPPTIMGDTQDAAGHEAVELQRTDGNWFSLRLKADGATGDEDLLRQLGRALRACRDADVVLLHSDFDHYLPDGAARHADLLREALSELSRLRMPVIAVVDKSVVNAGLLLVLACDLAVYGEEGRYGGLSLQDHRTHLGLVDALVSQRFGIWGNEWVLSGDLYDGHALRRRLPLLHVCPARETSSRAQRIAEQLLVSSRGLLGRKSSLAAQLRHHARPVHNSGDPAGVADLPVEQGELALTSNVVRASVDADGIVLVRLEDRDERNMFSDALIAGLQEVFDRIQRLPGGKAVVLVGYDTYFASGGTQQGLKAIQEGKVRFTDLDVFQLPMRCPLPVIAAMQGHGIGAGWTLGLFCDSVVFSEESRYVSPYLNFGFTPGAGATGVLPAKLGFDLARESLFTGGEMSGEALGRRNPLLTVLPRDRVLAEALALARKASRHGRSDLIAWKAATVAHRFDAWQALFAREVEMHAATLVGQAEARARIERRFGPQSPSPAQGETREAAMPPASAVSRSTLAPTSAHADILPTIRRLLADELRIAETEIDPRTPFVELGLDSISGVSWIRKINERFRLAIEATKVYAYPTIEKFARFVRELLPQTPATEEAAAPDAHAPRTESMFSFDWPALSSWRTHTSAATPVREAGRPAACAAEIAVIGMAGRFPMAQDVDAFWDNIASGRNCISEVPASRWDTRAYYVPGQPGLGQSNSKWMGVLEGHDRFDPLFFGLSPIEAESMDPQQRLFLQCCWHGMEDAGYTSERLSGSKCGVFVGCAYADYNLLSRAQQIGALGFTGGATSILAARVSYFLNLQGPCVSIDTACSSSLVAIASACDSLVTGASDMAFAGGVYVMANADMFLKTAHAGMLSPDGRCYTFDQRANGFVPGEGVGVVLLKRLADAERDGDRILGVLRGWGVNQDGRTNGITAPNAESQQRLITDVYERFEVNPEDIQLIEAHGTGTKLGDPIEVEGLKSAFRPSTDRKGFCAIGSVKTNIGHCLTAAGVSGLIKLLLALKHRQLPPSINFEMPNEHLDLDNSPFFVNTTLRDWTAPPGVTRHAAISSFGFSGTNAHLVLAEHMPRSAPAAGASPGTWVHPDAGAVIPLSARTPERLRQKAMDLRDFVHADPGLDLASLAGSLQMHRDAMDQRLCFVARRADDVIDGLTAYIDGTVVTASLPGAVFAGNVKQGRESVRLLSDDAGMAALVVDKCIADGNFARLCELWVKGLALEWRKLYGQRKPATIILPKYPFADDAYWIAPSGVTCDAAPSPRNDKPRHLHPLLQEKLADLRELGYRPSTGDEETADHAADRTTLMHLPIYAFARMRCWIPSKEEVRATSSPGTGTGVAPSAQQGRFLQNLDSIADLFAELEQDRLTAREVAARVKQLA
jgi:3-oxoacyl-(acyl-carrier-protein) synthase/enoyl-CoA hydratase/carnithine racemase/acyl carrier protein